MDSAEHGRGSPVPPDCPRWTGSLAWKQGTGGICACFDLGKGAPPWGVWDMCMCVRRALSEGVGCGGVMEAARIGTRAFGGDLAPCDVDVNFVVCVLMWDWGGGGRRLNHVMWWSMQVVMCVCVFVRQILGCIVLILLGAGWLLGFFKRRNRLESFGIKNPQLLDTETKVNPLDGNSYWMDEGGCWTEFRMEVHDPSVEWIFFALCLHNLFLRANVIRLSLYVQCFVGVFLRNKGDMYMSIMLSLVNFCRCVKYHV